MTDKEMDTFQTYKGLFENKALYELMFAEAILHRGLHDGYLMTTKNKLKKTRNQESLLYKTSIVGTDYLFFMELLKGHHTEWLEELLKKHKDLNHENR